MASVFSQSCGPMPAAGDGGTDGGGNGDASSGAVTGTFRVALVAPTMMTPGQTTVVGRIQNGESPSQIIWTEAMRSGDCALVTPRVPSCTPGCGSSAACVADNTCQPYPTAQNAGTVTITGLGASPITLVSAANSYQLPAGTTLAYPPFADGAALSLAIGGAGAIPAMSVTGTAIAPLAVTSQNLMVAASTAVNLTWTAGAAASDARIKVKLDISHHGGTRGMITCDTADDGSLEIAAPLVTALVSLGVAGFPSIVVTRERASSAAAMPSVKMLVVSDVEQYVTVPGVRSCTTDDDCMGNGRCRDDLTCGS
ncbi:MAG: hypothetical protein JNK05_40885 [Myxococcales bacterium]|nr:hypothetical protein [Myxococcales bacterium]